MLVMQIIVNIPDVKIPQLALHCDQRGARAAATAAVSGLQLLRTLLTRHAPLQTPLTAHTRINLRVLPWQMEKIRPLSSRKHLVIGRDLYTLLSQHQSRRFKDALAMISVRKLMSAH